MRWSTLILAAGLLCSAAPAAAFFYTGARGTVGNEDYRGGYAYMHFGGAWNFRPSVSAYHDAFSSGTYTTISARLAYDSTHWGLGVSGGGTPAVNGYSNWFYGADGTVTFLFGKALAPRVIDLQSPSEEVYIVDFHEDEYAAPGWGLARIDLRPSVLRIVHGDDFRSPGMFPNEGSTDIGQTDLRGTLGVLLLKDYLTFDFTKSHYDHGLAASDLRARSQNLAGLDAMIQGFPNVSYNVRLDLTMIPMLVPYVGFGHTTFELAQPSLRVYTVGGYLRVIRHLELGGTYQDLRENGLPDLHLTSFEANLRF